jgi:hypothetical protein
MDFTPFGGARRLYGTGQLRVARGLIVAPYPIRLFSTPREAPVILKGFDGPTNRILNPAVVEHCCKPW